MTDPASKSPASLGEMAASAAATLVVVVMMAGVVAMPLMFGWAAVENFDRWWKQHTVFEFVALMALMSGMAHVSVSMIVAAIGLGLFKLLSVRPGTEQRVSELAERVSWWVAIPYAVPGVVCGWIALSWWLLTGDYLRAELNHPGVLESTIGGLVWLAGRILGIVGFYYFGKACVFVLTGRWRKRPSHPTSPVAQGDATEEPLSAPLLLAERCLRPNATEFPKSYSHLMRLMPAAHHWSRIASSWLPTLRSNRPLPVTQEENAAVWVGEAIEDVARRILVQAESMTSDANGTKLDAGDRAGLSLVQGGLKDLKVMDMRALWRLEPVRHIVEKSGFFDMDGSWWSDVFSGDGRRQAVAINTWMASLPGVLAAKLGDANASHFWKARHPELNTLSTYLEVESMKRLATPHPGGHA